MHQVQSSRCLHQIKMDLDFLRLIGKLKTVPRAGWVLRGIHDPESVADHSWRMSVMALFLLQDLPTVNAVRACQIALVHDLAEAEVGDITPFDGITPEDKHQREHDAMFSISRMLTHCTTANSASSAQLLELYQEYDKGETLEAQYVKDIDKLDMYLQADAYERSHRTKPDLQSFFIGAQQKMKTEWGLNVLRALEHERNERKRGEKDTNDKTESVRNVVFAVSVVGLSLVHVGWSWVKR